MNVIDVADQKQLFLDDRWFDTNQGMTLCVNPPVKAERVLLPEKPWESYGICCYHTVLEHEGVYKMWYDAISLEAHEAPHERVMCYATSEDGIHWQRQNVNLFEWEGLRENNIVMAGANGSVMIDPLAPEDERYKALVIIKENEVWPESRGCVCGCYDGKYFMELYLCTSPDGLHWRRRDPYALPFFHDSQNVFLYDPRLKKYVAYVRTHRRDRTVGRLEFDDPLNLPWPFREVTGGERGPGGARHAVGEELDLALACDESDPPDTDLYTPSVERYPWAAEAYFSFTTPYRHYPVGDTSDTTLTGRDDRGRHANDGPIEVQLAVSRDGINWSRPDRRPYVPLGLAGSFDGGQTYMSLGMIRKGDDIWQYYTGLSHTHGAYEASTHAPSGAICRLVQRLDGFISADAAYEGAEFTTPVLRFSGDHLELNANCSALGEIRVEIRDEDNVPIPGYTVQESLSVDRNHITAPVRWLGHDDVSELTGRPVRLHFELRACKLYAFQFLQR